MVSRSADQCGGCTGRAQALESVRLTTPVEQFYQTLDDLRFAGTRHSTQIHQQLFSAVLYRVVGYDVVRSVLFLVQCESGRYVLDHGSVIRVFRFECPS